MKKLVALVMVVAMAISGTYCCALELDTGALEAFTTYMEFSTDTKAMRLQLAEKIQYLNDKYDSGKELNEAEALLYLEYAIMYLRFADIEVVELLCIAPDEDTLKEYEALEVHEFVEKVEKIKDYYLLGLYTKDEIASQMREMLDGITEQA